MKKILFLDTVHPLLAEVLEKKGYECILEASSPKSEIEKIVHQFSGIIIRSRFRIDQDFLDKCKNLKFIGRFGAGMENIDVDYARSKGIECLHAPEGNRDAVGEQAVGMILSLFNRLCIADTQVRAGIWIREGNRGIELSGKTVGIIGYGNTGAAFARKLQGFDCKVLAFDKYKSGFGNENALESNMDQIFNEADILSLHLPLTEETNFLMDDAFINQFKKNIFIVNTSRGKIVKTADFVKNLQTGKVRGACLDVLEYEAISFENVNFEQLPPDFQYLIKSENVVLSPHIAGWTHESNEKMAIALADKIVSLDYGF